MAQRAACPSAWAHTHGPSARPTAVFIAAACRLFSQGRVWPLARIRDRLPVTLRAVAPCVLFGDTVKGVEETQP